MPIDSTPTTFHRPQVLSYPKDPRRLLVDEKYFSLRPEPLVQWVYGLQLSQSAERVFWLHWDTGLRRGNFTSELSIQEVARRCFCDKSAVTRAYQKLSQHGLIRRHSPGRDPRRPFAEAIKVTEVRIPVHALEALLSQPDRPKPSAPETAAAKENQTSTHTQPKPAQGHEEPNAAHGNASPETPPVLDATTYWNQCTEILKSAFSEQDFTTRIRPLQPELAGDRLILWAPNSFAVEWVRANHDRIRSTLAGLTPSLPTLECRVGCRQTATSAPPSMQPTHHQPAKPVHRPRPRHLSDSALAQLRLRVLNALPPNDKALDDRFREIVWSIEQGGGILGTLEIPKAVNSALKKLREGHWTRPNRMPPNWRRCLDDARHEVCRAA